MAKIIIPTPLRKFTDNHASIVTTGETVGEAIKDLASHFPGLEKHLYDSTGTLRTFVRIFVGDDDIKSLDDDLTKVQEDTVISIIPAIAGGKK